MEQSSVSGIYDSLLKYMKNHENLSKIKPYNELLDQLIVNSNKQTRLVIIVYVNKK